MFLGALGVIRQSNHLKTSKYYCSYFQIRINFRRQLYVPWDMFPSHDNHSWYRKGSKNVDQALTICRLCTVIDPAVKIFLSNILQGKSSSYQTDTLTSFPLWFLSRFENDWNDSKMPPISFLQLMFNNINNTRHCSLPFCRLIVKLYITISFSGK